MKRIAHLRFAVPVAAILLSVGVVLLPAIRDYANLRQLARGSKYISTGPFVIPTDHLFRMSVEMSAYRQQRTVILLNAPGQLLYSLALLPTGRDPHWCPPSIDPSLWRTISLPVCAFPMWFFLGRAIDAWFGEIRLRRADLFIGATLLIFFLALSAGLRFGLSPQERGGQDFFFWGFVYGFALWAGLLTIPVVTWLKQRKSLRPPLSR